MKKPLVQSIIQKIRDVTPLSLRRSVGPAVGYVSYVLNVYVKKEKIHVLSLEETLDLIATENLSVIRYGDGEIFLIDNHNLGFQEKNDALAERLKKILGSDIKGLLICVPGIFGKINTFTKTGFWFGIHHLFRYRHLWEELLLPGKTYGNAFITRPYLSLKDRSRSGIVFDKILSLWKDQDVTLIEGEGSRLGVGNNLFDAVKSLRRILCPSENAYSKYDAIKEESVKIDKSRLILVSLGPAGKVLAYDLFLLGYRVIDIGHIDMEYEMFLRKETLLTKVKYKYFNEINERNPEECLDPVYTSQISATIR